MDMACLAAATDCGGDNESGTGPPSNGGVSAKAAKTKRSILKRANSSPAERENLLAGDEPVVADGRSNHSKKPSSSSAADSTANSGESGM